MDKSFKKNRFSFPFTSVQERERAAIKLQALERLSLGQLAKSFGVWISKLPWFRWRAGTLPSAALERCQGHIFGNFGSGRYRSKLSKKPIKPQKLDKFMFSLFEFYDFYAMVQTFPNTLPACASLSTMNPMHRNHPLPMRIILVLVCSLKHRCARRATKPRPGCFWGATGSVWMRVRRL